MKVSCCLDINHHCHVAQEISTLASPMAIFFPCFKSTWSNPVSLCVCFGLNVSETDEICLDLE